MRSIIRKILRENFKPTETSYLGWSVPKNLYDDLDKIGVRLWNKDNDRIYVSEIQFDTKSVVFEILDSEGEAYFNSTGNVPSSYESYHKFKIKDLPKKIKSYITRRIENNWFDYFE